MYYSAQVYEEEDFQPMGYGYCLGTQGNDGNDVSAEITEQKSITLLREQEDDLYRRSRNNQQDVRFLYLIANIPILKWPLSSFGVLSPL